MDPVQWRLGLGRLDRRNTALVVGAEIADVFEEFGVAV